MMRSETKKENEMKIVLCYKEFELGELSQENSKYVFEPVSGCELARQRYIIPRASELLSGGRKTSDKLFGEYAYFLNLLRNNYVKSEANIIGDESDFEKLSKIAKLNLERGSFYIKLRK